MFAVAQRKSVVTSTITYTSGKDTVKGFLCLPDTIGPSPAVILIHEWWGLTEWMKANARSFALRGYATLALDLYRGRITELPDEARTLSQTLPQQRVRQDLQAAFRYLQSRREVKANHIGTVGWCMGGKYALQFAVANPDLAACVVCYGELITDSLALSPLRCPVLGIFGDADTVIKPEQVNQFILGGKKAGKKIRTVMYPNARHAFMNPTNEALYSMPSAVDAWKQIYTFIDSTLSK